VTFSQTEDIYPLTPRDKGDFIMKLIRPGRDELGEEGFTFIELLIATVLSLIVLVPLFNMLIDQQKNYQVQCQMTNMRQNARIALDVMTKEIRMAGYGIPGSTWSDAPASPTPELKIAQTPNATSITFYSNIDGVKSVLSADEANGQTVLSVESTTYFAEGDSVYIEGPDDAASPTTHWHSSTIPVTGITGTTITISSALNFTYRKGSTIHKKDTLIYNFNSGNREITRSRNGNNEVLAYEIQGMTLNYTFEDGGTGLPDDADGDATNDSEDIRMINMSITAQTKDEDPFLNTERTTTFSSDVTPLNLAY
jgi:type II secretory pathway component PulJ